MKDVFSTAPAAFWKFGCLAFAFARPAVMGQWRRVLWGSVGEKCERKVWNKVTYFQKNASAVVKIDSATGSCLWVCGIVWVRIIREFLPLALGDTSRACSL